ncbi:28S ribosomal protein S10, mitochondrial [Strongyloides ratti]|uniref:Small ribosomal subunit protein uS10m n=1 Tax=Strongyloides ratti TaxID=34506 RepID=A0A090LJL9_STRRB|nr:28S ribosomal protein S10, mitochondrial [Strongyloides ratti]CEF67695.1 28S ribosomal protein S10, mitochondrial [Strongyloides ratti]
MLASTLKRLTTVNISNTYLKYLSTSENNKELDKLFSNIRIEYRGHDPAVLQSYSSFLLNVCEHLKIDKTPVKKHPYVRWVEWLLRSKFVHKKYKLHYETRTHIREISIKNVTGSTASTFLEYVQRNIPEGVAMKVDYTEITDFPDPIKKLMEKK